MIIITISLSLGLHGLDECLRFFHTSQLDTFVHVGCRVLKDRRPVKTSRGGGESVSWPENAPQKQETIAVNGDLFS